MTTSFEVTSTHLLEGSPDLLVRLRPAGEQPARAPEGSFDNGAPYLVSGDHAVRWPKSSAPKAGDVVKATYSIQTAAAATASAES
jgi:hypothetical protein